MSIQTKNKAIRRFKVKVFPTLSKGVQKGVSAYWDMMEHGVTQSSMAAYTTCPMKAKLKLIEGLEGGYYNPALDFGSLFHDVLDKVYSQRIGAGRAFGSNWDHLSKLCLDRKYKEVLAEALDIKGQQEFEKLWGMCSVVLPMYFKRWDKKDTKFKWIAVEEVFEFPFKLCLLDGSFVVIIIRGKWDGLIEDASGGIWLFETKTKQDIEDMAGGVSCNAVLEKMSYELQVMVYCLAIKAKYGKWPKGVIYNLVKRPGQEYKGTFNRKPETLPQYFERIQKHMNEKGDAYFCRYIISLDRSEIMYYRDNDLVDIMTRMYNWYKMGGSPSQRVSAACSMWRKPCEFLPICSGEDSKRTGYVKRLHVFPELMEVVD